MSRTKRTIPHWAKDRSKLDEYDCRRCPYHNGRDRKPMSYVFERADGKGYKEVFGPKGKRYRKRRRNKWLRRQKWPT